VTKEQLALIEKARRRRLSYGVSILRAPDGRELVVLGEAHLKLPWAARLGREFVNAFELRGVEGFPTKRVISGRLLMVLIVLPRIALRILSLGLIRASTITEARAASRGTTFPLESVSEIPISLHAASIYLSAFFTVGFASLLFGLGHPPVPRAIELASMVLMLHFPLVLVAALERRQSWHWWIHPAVAILTARDATMAEGTAHFLGDHSAPGAALVIMGRAHVGGYTRELVEKYGYSSPRPMGKNPSK
jgi:hypothetical protein